MADQRRRRKTKDRVLQARIPRQLDDELRHRAERLGLSVSTIVRNVLLNTFDLVEGVVADSAQLARAMQDSSPASADPATGLPGPVASSEDPPVLGWQEAILNRNGVCEQCNEVLTRGSHAAIGLPLQSRPVLLCLPCLQALSGADEAGSPPAPPT